MPVTKRGKSYQATVHHKGNRYRETFKTEAEAKSWELKAKAALVVGEPIPVTGDVRKGKIPTTMRQLADMTHTRYWKNITDQKAHNSHLNILLGGLGEEISPRAIDETVIDALIEVFENMGHSDGTINRRLSLLSKMLSFALERNFITRKPKIEMKPKSQHRIRFFTQDEEDELVAFFKFIGKVSMADMIIVAIDTGMRRGELLKFKIQHCNFTDKLIQLPGNICKSGKPRDIPMTQRVEKTLKRLSEDKGRVAGTVFNDWYPSLLAKYWNKGRDHMGMMDDSQFVFHTLRHTFCSRLVQRGVQLQVVCELAGHADISMTMRYAHLCPTNLRSAIKLLET